MPGPKDDGTVYHVPNSSVGMTLTQARNNSDLLLLAVTTSAIIGYHVFIHDMAILLLPLAVWLGRAVSTRMGSCR